MKNKMETCFISVEGGEWDPKKNHNKSFLCFPSALIVSSNYFLRLNLNIMNNFVTPTLIIFFNSYVKLKYDD